MATYYKSDSKITVANTIDVANSLVVPAGGNGIYDFYTCPSTKYALFQVHKIVVTGSGSLGWTIQATSRAQAYSGVNTIIKDMKTTSGTWGTFTYTPQATDYNILPGALTTEYCLDPFTYLRSYEALLYQGKNTSSCALIGPNDFIRIQTGGFDPDNGMYIWYRVYEFDIY